jgi:hypothetical protein
VLGGVTSRWFIAVAAGTRATADLLTAPDIKQKSAFAAGYRLDGRGFQRDAHFMPAWTRGFHDPANLHDIVNQTS